MSLNWSPQQWLMFHQYGNNYCFLSDEDKAFWDELNEQYEKSLAGSADRYTGAEFCKPTPTDLLKAPIILASVFGEEE